MSSLDLLLISIALAMDAFAVAICKGLAMKKVNYKHCFIIALFFGGFQGLMPLIGWAVGTTFASKIKMVDHWIAFILLAYIGGKMIFDAIKEWKEDDGIIELDPPLDIKELLIFSIATSIDALACGVTFSFTENFKIIKAVLVIGITTFILSTAGVFIGNIFGSKYKAKAQLLGGIILVFLGVKILLEHFFGIKIGF